MTPSEPDDKIPGPVFFSRNVVRGIPWTMASKLVLFFVYFGISIVVVRKLGAEKYGVFSLCRVVGDFVIVICGLGLNTALIRFIPELTVRRDRAGLARIVTKTAFLQMAMVCVSALVLQTAKPLFDKWFSVDFGYLLLFTALLAAAQLSKSFTVDTLTALFQVRTISIMSVCQGFLTFGLTAVLLSLLPQVQMAILAQVVSIGGVSCAGIIVLRRFLSGLDWRSPVFSIGKRRILSVASASLLDALANMFTRQYSELFFLGIFFTPAVVGVYDVGCSIPFLLITFIPLSLYTLFTSGFSEAYAKDPNCLGNLIASCYKALIATVIPVTAFGCFFGPDVIRLMYGEEMVLAGAIASVFFVVHTVTLLSTPLSMAIVVKEKILQMLPLTLLDIAINLSLDYVFIRRYGMYGAVGAVLGTFLLTLPLRLYMVVRFVGGVYFPLRFFAKIAVCMFVLAGMLSVVLHHLNIVTMFNLGIVLFSLGIGYVGAYFVMIKRFGLIRRQDVSEWQSLGFHKLNRLLDFLFA